MNETLVTVVGNVVTEVTEGTTPTGIEFAHFRVASTIRRFDRGIGQWADGDTNYLKVTCWRRLARNVVESVSKGDPVVIQGTLKVREWANDDRRGTSVEIDANSVGHDLNRGVGRFTRSAKRESGPELSPEAPDAGELQQEAAA